MLPHESAALVRVSGSFRAQRSEVECLSDTLIAALADGVLPGRERDLAVAHVASCGKCRSAVASVRRALSDPDIEREIARPGASWWKGVAGLGVAAALVALLAWPRSAGVDLHRAPGGADAAQLITPSDTVASVERLYWGSVSAAERYRVTLYDAAGTVLHEAETADTSLALPEPLRLLGAGQYLWSVDTRTGWNRWTASRLIPFTVVTGPSP